DRRPALKALLDACREHRYDVVVVYSLDRWARNLKVILQTFGVLSDGHVAFASVTETIDYSTPEGRLFVAMLGAFAQYFSDSLAKHTSKGIAERVHQGRPAGPIPFGYQKGEGAVPEPVPEEAEAVADIFRMRVQGKTQAELASWLNGRRLRTRKGRRFDNFAVRDILANPFYTGRLRYRDAIVSGIHEALIDITLYEAVQAMRVPRHTGPQRHSYLLRGLVRCARCGGLLWSTSPHHGYTYYRQQASARCCYPAFRR
ncbi:MAG: recombinase family protein, partial [Candidatus Marinimicrobia bacterium]|nr:recombinase family protein [Candidatus Neomarinimicrobiota bacterium]